jgi:hypothetical protein
MNEREEVKDIYMITKHINNKRLLTHLDLMDISIIYQKNSINILTNNNHNFILHFTNN